MNICILITLNLPLTFLLYLFYHIVHISIPLHLSSHLIFGVSLNMFQASSMPPSKYFSLHSINRCSVFVYKLLGFFCLFWFFFFGLFILLMLSFDEQLYLVFIYFILLVLFVSNLKTSFLSRAHEEIILCSHLSFHR